MMGAELQVTKIGFMIALTQVGGAIAAEIKVKAGAATTGVLRELGPQFERATGHRIVFEFGLSGEFKRQIEAGEAFDVAIIAPELLDDLIKQGKIVADTRADFAVSALGWGGTRGCAQA
jgi:molybdate transport system substrate-binding protein